MTNEQIRAAIERLKPESKVKLVFLQTNFSWLQGLCECSRERVDLVVHEDDLPLACAMLITGSWYEDQCRVIRVKILEGFNVDRFMFNVGNGLKRMRFDGENRLVELGMRGTFPDSLRATLARECVPETLIELVDDWGLRIESRFVQDDNFPKFIFAIKNGENIVVEVVLDGWSGRICTNGVWGETYRYPRQVTAVLREQLDAYLERSTHAEKRGNG